MANTQSAPITPNNTVSKNANGHGYKYTDLAEINEHLGSQGITYWQYINTEDGTDYIYTVPIINGKELSPRRGCRVVEATLNGAGANNPAQLQGSALTYARRYSLLMAFGLATDDDDAASLNNTGKKQKPRTEQTAPNVEPIGNPATEKQIKLIKTLCAKLNFTYEKLLESNNMTGQIPTSDQASGWINGLQNRIKAKESAN